MADMNYGGLGGLGGESGGGLLLLIILLFGGGAGGFGGRNADSFSNEFVYTNLNNTVQRGNDALSMQTANLRNDLCQGFAGVNAGICDSSYKAQLCCCETNRNIDSLKFEGCQNKSEIIANATYNAQRLLDSNQQLKDMATDNVIRDLRDKLQTQTLVNSQAEQDRFLVNRLAPCPVPAYCVPSPCPCTCN